MRAERRFRQRHGSGLVVLGVSVGCFAARCSRNGIAAQVFVSAPGKYCAKQRIAEGSQPRVRSRNVAERSQQERCGSAVPSVALLAQEGKSTSLQPFRFGLPLPSPAAVATAVATAVASMSFAFEVLTHRADIWSVLAGSGSMITWQSILEITFFGLLILTSIYCLYQSAILKRRSKTAGGLLHAVGGISSTVLAAYGIASELFFREAPGAWWGGSVCIAFLVNCFAMWSLMDTFKPRELTWQGFTVGKGTQEVLVKLGYSFVVSFQGIHLIAWSAQFPLLFWAVMPFWYWSIKKLAESSDHMLALLPQSIPQASAARRRLGVHTMDAPTVVYSALNFAGAVFDNFYMAAYTYRGPDGFWSEAMQDPILSHIILVRPAAGSLTLSLLVFIGTLVYRRKVPLELGLLLNVLLGSFGPWIVLLWHKLIDPNLPWFPELGGNWVSHTSPLLEVIASLTHGLF